MSIFIWDAILVWVICMIWFRENLTKNKESNSWIERNPLIFSAFTSFALVGLLTGVIGGLLVVFKIQ